MSILDIGQSFGEDSALNNTKMQEMIEAVSEKVIAYRIDKSLLLQNFGGSSSEIIYALRGYLQNKKIWLKLKQQELVKMKKDDVLRFVQFKDENEFKGLNPTKTLPGETPFLETVLMYGKKKKETVQEPSSKPAENKKPDEPKKKPCFRELPKRVNKEEKEEKDYTGILGFGTQRLVPSKRLTQGMNQTQIRGMLTLKGIAENAKSGGKANQDQKEDFSKEAISKFQNSVMNADPEIAQKKNEQAPNGPNVFRKLQMPNVGLKK